VAAKVVLESVVYVDSGMELTSLDDADRGRRGEWSIWAKRAIGSDKCPNPDRDKGRPKGEPGRETRHVVW
jgi:hypothetical protein